jgi:hypothetical protein
MAHFNLDDYETVEQRIKRFYEVHPDGRIITENLTTDQDRQVSTWVVKASIYFDREDQANGLPKATGMAFEIDGAGMANKTSALENCETSSIGRALANANFSGNKRASREEMEKVERSAKPVEKFDAARIKGIKSKSDARKLWVEANKAGAAKKILDEIAVAGSNIDVE